MNGVVCTTVVGQLCVGHQFLHCLTAATSCPTVVSGSVDVPTKIDVCPEPKKICQSGYRYKLSIAAERYMRVVVNVGRLAGSTHTIQTHRRLARGCTR